MEPERYDLGALQVDARTGRVARAGVPLSLSAAAVEALVGWCRDPRAAHPAPLDELRGALGEDAALLRVDEDGVRWDGPTRRVVALDFPEENGYFEVLGLLGEGGMAQVYLVRHPVLQRRYALKVVGSNAPHLTERILREAQAQASVQHPNVLEVLDVFVVDSRPAILLPLVEGPTLLAALSRTGPDIRTWYPVFRDVVAGVAAIHRVGLVHRDLKPSNILLDVSGPTLVPKVADFGVAKALADHRAQQHLTGRGTALGTPPYAAPEQLRDAVAVDARADVFALGCLLHELLTGAPPLRPDGVPRVAPTDPLWSTLLQRMLRLDPGERFADADALLTALPEAGPAEEGLAIARGLTPVPSSPGSMPKVLRTMTPTLVAPTPPSRGRAAAVVLVVAVLLVLILAGLWR